MTLTNEELEDIQALALNRASAYSLTEWIEGLTTQLAEARADAQKFETFTAKDGEVSIRQARADALDVDALADAFTWLHIRLDGGCAESHAAQAREYAALDAAQEDRFVSEPTTCPNCGTDKVKFHVRQYDCRTCYPLGRLYPVGTDIDRADHRHWSCANGHRWADSA